MVKCLDIRSSKDLILYKTYAELRAETERTYLGIAWWIIEPFINMVIFYIVFGRFMGAGSTIPNFIPFLLVGMIVWQWFGATIPQCSYSILGNATLVRQVTCKKVVFPLIAILVNTVKFGIALLVLFAFLLMFRQWPTVYYAALPVILAVQFLLILGVGLVMASVVPFFPDIRRILDHVLRIMFFMSGIMYDIDRFGPLARRLLMLNPLTLLIRAYRDALMYARWPDWTHLGIIAAVSCVLIYLGAYIIHRLDPVYAKRILE